MKKRMLWILLLILGACPFLAPFVYWLIDLVAHNQYWELTDMLIVWSFLYWPTYVIGLVLLVIAIYKLKK